MQWHCHFVLGKISIWLDGLSKAIFPLSPFEGLKGAKSRRRKEELTHPCLNYNVHLIFPAFSALGSQAFGLGLSYTTGFLGLICRQKVGELLSSLYNYVIQLLTTYLFNESAVIYFSGELCLKQDACSCGRPPRKADECRTALVEARMGTGDLANYLSPRSDPSRSSTAQTAVYLPSLPSTVVEMETGRSWWTCRKWGT